MPQWLFGAASSSALALASTGHFALALLRKHRSFPRGGFSSLLIPSFLLVVAPWFLPSPAGLGTALLVHLAWFAACEKLVAPPQAAAPASSEPAKARPAPDRAPRQVSLPSPPAPRGDGFVTVPVLAVLDESAEIRTFRLSRPSGFEFRAGQFVTVRVQVDGRPLVRCYSISSAPETSGYLEISVRRQGLVSGTLHSVVRPGSTLSIRKPAGGFVYPGGDERPLFLLAGGVGITPLISMLRHAVSAEPNRPVTLVLSVRDEHEIPFRDELHVLGRRNPQVRVVIAVTRGVPSPGLWPGRIDARLVGQIAPDPASAVWLLCGPLPMIASMKQMLAELKVPAAQVKSEAFEAAVAAAAAPALPPESAVPAIAAVSAESAAPAPRRRKAGCTLELSRSRRRIEVEAGQSLLEAVEAAGSEIPSSCRAGICGTCRTRVVSGTVDCESDTLDAAERDEGWTLPCVAFASGPVVVEA